MIPLSRWLKDRDRADARQGWTIPGDSAAPDVPSEEYGASTASIALDDLQSRIAELEKTLSTAAKEFEDERAAALLREQDISARLGADMVSNLEGQIKACLASMQEEIESALADVLKPFLSRAAVDLAARELREMISGLMKGSEPLIEARAPLGLHDLLVEAFGEAGATVILKESDVVELAFTSRTTRFELLAERWLEVLEGNDHEQ